MRSSWSHGAKALAVACAYIRVDPGLRLLVRVNPDADELRAFFGEKDVGPWLSKVYRRRGEKAGDLLDAAFAWVLGGGEAACVYALYTRQERAGDLAALKPADLAAHRAVFTLAVVQGRTVMASTRYLSAAVMEQSGVRVPHNTVGRVLRRLQARGLVGYEPGHPGLKVRAGRVSLDLSPVQGVPDDVDPEVVGHLALSDEAWLRLQDFVAESRDRRSVAVPQMHEEGSRSAREAESLRIATTVYQEAIDEDLFRAADEPARLAREEAVRGYEAMEYELLLHQLGWAVDAH